MKKNPKESSFIAIFSLWKLCYVKSVMKNSDDVFNLVHSLTPAEKRYFRNFANRHVIGKKNNYLVLFEAMQQQREYDEAAIKEAFANEPFIGHFRILKHNLYQQLLKSLAHHSTSLDARIFQGLLQVETLFNRGFYRQARKVLQKVKKFAREHEKLPAQLEVIRWEQRMRIATLEVKEAQQLVEEENNLLAVIENERRYHQLSFLVFSLFTRIGSIRREEDLQTVEALMADPLLANEDQALSDRARLIFHTLHTHYNFHRGNHELAYRYTFKAKELMESRPVLIRDNVLQYIVILHNYLILSTELERFEAIQPALETLQRISGDFSGPQSVKLEYWVFVLTGTFEIFYFLRKGAYEKSLARIPALEKGLNRYQKQINKRDRLIFLFNFAHTHFGLGAYSAALKYLNRILNEQESDMREDIFGVTQLLNLVVHYELENFELLEYLVKSTRKQLAKQGPLLQTDRFLLAFFKGLTGHKSQKERRSALEKLKKQLEILKEDRMETKRWQTFDFPAWIDSHLQQKSFQEIISNKSPQRS